MHRPLVLLFVSLLVTLVREVYPQCPRAHQLPVRTRGGKSMCARYYSIDGPVPGASCRRANVDVYNGEVRRSMPPGWNDVISAVVVRPGCTFRGYVDSNFRRERRDFTGVVHRMPSGFMTWDDVISSYTCSCGFPPITCTPRDAWETVHSCDNPNTRMASCQHRLTEGITVGRSITSGGDVSNTVTSSITAEFSQIFSGTLSVSRTTSYNWGRSTSADRTTSTTQVITADVPPGTIVRIRQVVGRCQDTTVFTERFQIVTYDRRTNRPIQTRNG